LAKKQTVGRLQHRQLQWWFASTTLLEQYAKDSVEERLEFRHQYPTMIIGETRCNRAGIT
jgi:hypothetical protein